MQNFHAIGIDISKHTLDVCAIFDEKMRKQTFDNTESGFKNLVKWKEKLGAINPHICMESTGCYSESAAEFFDSFGYKVSVVNPLQIKSFRMSKMIRQKTDSSDSECIAKFCIQNNPNPWHPKLLENKALHEIRTRINSLNVELNRVTNSLEKKHLNKVVLASINKEIKFIKKSIETLEKEAKRIIEKSEKLKQQYDLLTDINGVGNKTALAILADMPDVSRFENAKQYAAFVGVTPSHFQSGISVNGKSKISRLGSKKTRKTLYMCALVVKNNNPHFKKWVQTLENKGKPPKVIIVAVMRKLLHIFFGVLKNNQKFDPELAFHD